MKGIKNMDSIEEIKKKYAKSVIKNLNRENFYKIINFLESNNCDFIEDIVSDYLDLFNIEYVEFVKRYNKLNEKYSNNFLQKASEDMNLLEEFYNDSENN